MIVNERSNPKSLTQLDSDLQFRQELTVPAQHQHSWYSHKLLNY